MSDYQAVHKHFSRIYDLRHVQAISQWDEASMMPVGGGAGRGRALSTLGGVIHGMVTEPQLKDMIARAEGEAPDPWQQANLREIQRVVTEATALPATLVESMSLAASRCEQAWRTCRAANDWDSLVPLLTEVVRLAREKAKILGAAGDCTPYDALLDLFEPGVTMAMIDPIFADLKAFLPPFVEQVLERQSGEVILPVVGDFSIDRQRSLGLEVMAAMGFDFEHGRLDVSHHPFCGGVPDDVRITTRYHTDNFVQSLMAVIHETGHAMYEQGLPAAWRDQPVGEALSSATHESQSLLMEMQACRTPEFLQFLAPRAQRVFLGRGTNDPAWSADNLYRHYTRVNKSLIRVDADEATYPLHVILRYELEKDLIAGHLEARDIPAAWDAKMMTMLDVSTVGNFRDGCMQDVHWPAGLFGYFPTYTLGALTAAQLFAAANQALGHLHQDIADGKFAPLLAWLRQHVHSQGKFLAFDDLMKAATGYTLDARYFKDHLRRRYLP
jgi:carboxypeptidase Taq